MVALEELLRARWHVQLLSIRRCFTVAAGVLSSAATLAFAAARQPPAAAIAYAGVIAGHCLHHSGYSPNLLEVGGEDTAMLNALANMFKSTPGVIVPPLVGMLLARATGSWRPLFALSAGLHVCTSLFFGYYATMRTGRKLVNKRDTIRRRAGGTV